MKFLLLVFPLLLVASSHAAEFLGLFPVPGPSHWILGKAYLKGLADRGHSITVITPFQSDNPPLRWTEVIVPNTMHMMGDRTQLFKWSIKDIFGRIFKFLNSASDSCEAYLQTESVKNLYNSNKKFDAIIYEPFLSDCLLAFSHKFKAPLIVLSAFAGSAWITDMVGNPYPFAYVPDPMLGFTDHMTFLQRLGNAVFGTYFKFMREYLTIPKQDYVMRVCLNDSTIPSASELEKQAALLLINSHVSIGYPRPAVPNMVEVGGLHLQPPKELPQDLKKFLDDSKKGVIYFSLGSNLKSAEMPEEKIQAFVNAFSKLKQNVLWKWEADTLPGKPGNIKVGKWLPQSDILAHKNVLMFITHGGMLSTTEAVYCGVPLIGIPIFGDQILNMNNAERQGYGIKLDFGNVTAESLQWAISEVLNNPRYKERIQQVSHIFHDRPMTPLDEAVYWTEYIVRHRGAKHMRTAALDLTWYQYFLLDVIAFLLVGLTIAFILIFFTIKSVLKLFCRKSNKQAKDRKGKNAKQE